MLNGTFKELTVALNDHVNLLTENINNSTEQVDKERWNETRQEVMDYYIIQSYKLWNLLEKFYDANLKAQVGFCAPPPAPIPTPVVTNTTNTTTNQTNTTSNQSNTASNQTNTTTNQTNTTNNQTTLNIPSDNQTNLTINQTNTTNTTSNIANVKTDTTSFDINIIQMLQTAATKLGFSSNYVKLKIEELSKSKKEKDSTGRFFKMVELDKNKKRN